MRLKKIGIGLAIFLGVLFATGFLSGLLQAVFEFGGVQTVISMSALVIAIIAATAYFVIAARKRTASSYQSSSLASGEDSIRKDNAERWRKRIFWLPFVLPSAMFAGERPQSTVHPLQPLPGWPSHA